jgi:hypothetical protein
VKEAMQLGHVHLFIGEQQGLRQLVEFLSTINPDC